METVSSKIEIVETLSSVRNFSFTEKKAPVFDKEKVDTLLDKIIDFKSAIKNKINKIVEINENIEKITWLNDLDEESLMILNDLIATLKDLKSSLTRQYISFNLMRAKGIAKEEIKDFKKSIDELKESYEDLESVFFFLPGMPDFEETTARLSLV